MKKTEWKPYVFWVLFTEAAGALAGWLARDATRLYAATIAKPPLSPPAAVFPVAWAVLYALMGIGAAMVYLSPAGRERSRALRLFLVQLAFNLLWSILFFNFQAFGAAFLWLVILWVLIFRMTQSFRQIVPLAAGLQIPYLLWVIFAGYLNFGVWLLNR